MKNMSRSTVKLQSGELLVIEPESYLNDNQFLSGEPEYELPIDAEKFKKITKNGTKDCGNCGKELDEWEINVNVCNYYNPHHKPKKKGRIKFVCYRCACDEI